MKKVILHVILFWIFTGAAFCQVSVTGTVTDQAGLALIGANVTAKGYDAIGTITDVDGNFTLSVPNGVNTLKISYTGYTALEVDFSPGTFLNIILSEGKILEEVVVTALGIPKSAKTLGYSTSVVSGDQINITRNTSVLDALNGSVAGLTVSTASGAPGASTVVNIRGFNSVTGNNQPLYVIDGVPMNNRGNTSSANVKNANDDFGRSTDFGNQMNDINPNDIESLNVLKGSAASALYGSRAANGVILITTKKGKAGKMKIDLNTSFSTSDLLRVPFLQNTYGQGWSGLFAYEENGSWGPKTDDKIRRWGNVVNNSQQLKPFSVQENNIRDFFDLGTASNTSLSISGGNESSNYRLSYSLAKADGVVPTDVDSYLRNTFALSGGLKYGKVSISSTINYLNKDQKAVPTGQGDDASGGKVVWQELIQIPRDHSIVDYKKYNDPDDPARDFYNLDYYFTPYAQNPYWTLYNQGNQYNENRIFGNLDISYELSPKLKLTWRGGGDFSDALQKDWGNLSIITPGTPNSGSNNVAGSVSEMSRNNGQYNSDLILSFDSRLNDNFDLTAVIGQNVNSRSAKTVLSSITNLGIPDYFNLSNSTVSPTTLTIEAEQRLIGVYSSATVGYRNWLYLSLAARNDWSSTLPKSGNSYFYPGASMSFVLSEALSLPKQIDYLSDAIPYQIDPVYISGQTRAGGFANVNFPFGGISSFELANNPGNPFLKPELTDELELGFEAKLYRNRISLEATYYDKNTKDQIINLLVDGASGYTNQTVNLGTVNNKGVELLLNIIPVKSDHVEWGINTNYTKNTNVVKSLGYTQETSILLNSVYNVDLKAEVGKPLGAIYSPQPDRDPNGNIIVNATTGLPQQADEKAYRGSINPDFTFGFGSYVKLFGFTLGANGDFRKGGVFYSYTARLNYFVGNAWNSQYNDREPWVIPNSVVDNGDGTYAENTQAIARSDVFTYYGANNAYQFNHVIDKTFFKLRNVYLNYDLSEETARSLSLAAVNVGVFARNPVLWTPSENHFVDPESNTFGTNLKNLYGEFSTGPSTATYGVQLNVTF
ncbi:MAG: SusC/RagA family TonB-linked outer membrane protein [Saprospiraceae bacterium]|nr:SusC/RagA family TonB-linked outer membrane protein [Saprospiraceae bacterium]